MDYFTVLNPFFNEEKVNCAEISRKTGIKERTVRFYFEKFRKMIPLPRKVEKGRPRKFPSSLNTQIGLMITQNPMASSNVVAERLNRSLEGGSKAISARTVRRRCQEMGYSSKKPTTIPMMTNLHVEKRIKFAKKNEDIDWDSVIFSDESSFQLRSNVVKFWTKKGCPQILEKNKFEPKIMVWGAISAAGKSKLFVVKGIMNSVKYTGVIDHVLQPFIRKYHDDSVIFQQDNAPCHVSRASKEHFAKKNIQIMEWPPNSPDLNPIENLWGYLKLKVAKRSPKTILDLENVLKEEWSNLTLKYLQSLVRSMPKRLEELKAKKGGKINY